MSIQDSESIAITKHNFSIRQKLSLWIREYKTAATKINQQIPMGGDYKKRVQREIVTFLRESMTKFNQLNSMDIKTKEELRQAVRSHSKVVAKFEGSKKVYLTSLGVLLYFFTFLLPSLILPFLAPSLFKISISLIIVVPYFIPCYFISGTMFTYSYKFLLHIMKKTNVAAYSITFVSFAFIQGVLIYYIFSLPNDTLIFLLSTPLLINETALILFVIVLIVLVLGFGIWGATRFRQMPVAYIAHEHLQALSLLSEYPTQSSDINHRKIAADHLLSAARYCSTYLDKYLMIKDVNINNWSSAFISEISSGIRNMAKSALISTNNMDLQAQLTKNFVALSTSNFTACITAQSESISPSERKKILKGKLLTLIIGILPLLVFYGLRWTRLIVNIQVLDYPIIVSSLWLIANLISIVDPAINERIKALKEIVSLFPPK